MTTTHECIAATELYIVAKELRQELKEWEQSFAAAHQGRKAERADIKLHPDIAHKYKQYERLRRPASRPPVSHQATPSITRSAPQPYPPVLSSRSPHKRAKHAEPTSQLSAHSHNSTHPRQLSPRALRTSIGPTPQKDGQVLGLFDLISVLSNSQTPSKRKALHSVEANVQRTPSKRVHRKNATDEETEPPSSLSGSNSKITDHILTPPHLRIANFSTPNSHGVVSNLRFDDTPAFLRRDSQRADERNEIVLRDEGVSWSPIAVRKLPKVAGRGLSALVRGLREMEDERLDEEFNILREMERESVPQNHWDQPQDLDESQRPAMPLGSDHGLEGEEDGLENSADASRENEKSSGVWKKKGQKRTTRRTLMMPNTARWKPEPPWKVDKANGDEKDCLAKAQTSSAGRVTEYGEDSDRYDKDLVENEGVIRASNRREYILADGLEHRKGLVKKVKKISATAHANFRALKIKNRQSKIKKVSRFGRQR